MDVGTALSIAFYGWIAYKVLGWYISYKVDSANETVGVAQPYVEPPKPKPQPDDTGTYGYYNDTLEAESKGAFYKLDHDDDGPGYSM